MIKHKTTLMAAMTLFCATGYAADNKPMNFVGCPIVQDTPSVPCWLVEYEGETYYMGIQMDVSAPFNPPSLGHKVLVEGQLTDRMECGARVIDPITISIMPELSPECDEKRMVQDGIDISFTPPRPPGPSAGRLAFNTFEPKPDPQPPFDPRSFQVTYSFDGLVTFALAATLLDVLDYGKISKAGTVEIRAGRGATRLVDGTLLVEREGIARERADQLVYMLSGAGMADADFKIMIKDEPVEGGAESRQVEIRVVP